MGTEGRLLQVTYKQERRDPTWLAGRKPMFNPYRSVSSLGWWQVERRRSRWLAGSPPVKVRGDDGPPPM